MRRNWEGRVREGLIFVPTIREENQTFPLPNSLASCSLPSSLSHLFSFPFAFPFLLKILINDLIRSICIVKYCQRINSLHYLGTMVDSTGCHPVYSGFQLRGNFVYDKTAFAIKLQCVTRQLILQYDTVILFF